jgi:hypothetical protein
MANDSSCSVDGCSRPCLARDLCRTHLERRYGRRVRVDDDAGPDPFASLRTPTKRCSIKDCAEAATARGWCGRHYHRWKKHGDPNAKVRKRATVNEPIKHDRGPAKYGLTDGQFEDMWIAQDGRCAICRTELVRTGMKSCNIDHCHNTGRVRGILCRGCNWGVGILGDDPDRLEAAARYLRKAAEPGGPNRTLRPVDRVGRSGAARRTDR